MISENLIGQSITHKEERGVYKFTIIEVKKETAIVKVTFTFSKHPHSYSVYTVEWTEGELLDYGFEV